MKRIAISFIAFLVIISIGIIGAVYFDITCKEVRSGLEQSIYLAEKGAYASAAVTAQNTERFWEKRRRILNLYVNHGLLYEVDSRLTGLAQLSSEEAKEEFLSTAEQAVQSIEYIKKDK